MRDSELAVSIVDGDPGALAEAYSKYGDLLWSYCRSMLSDADHAAEAVLDTFVIAASRLDVLPAVGRLRAWLYAVARCECMRRLRLSRGAAAVDEAPRLRQAAAVLSTGEQRQFRAVLRAAFGGLDEAERDVMTMVWHGLDLAEVAVVLGLSRSDAYALFTRARDQLEESVGVLLVGWSGRVDCAGLDMMLTGHDRRLSPDLRTRLTRHMGRCGVCAQRRHREMRPALMLGLSMGALLAEASEARAVAGRAPRGLWEEVYRMTSDKGPEAVWRRALGGRRVSFGEDGFPKALGGRDGLMTAPRLAVAAVGTVAVAATATGFAAAGHHTTTTAGATSVPVTAVIPGAASSATVPLASSHGAGAHDKTMTVRPGRRSRSASPSALPALGGATSAAARGGSAGTPSVSRTGGATTSTSTSASSGPSSSSGSGGSAAPVSSASPSPSSAASSSPSPSGSAGASQGTLSVSTSNIALAVGSSASFTLSASGGPVNWSISVPSGLLGSISLSQTSGTLAAGQSVTITVEASGLATLGTPLTISPGGQTVTVDISLL